MKSAAKQAWLDLAKTRLLQPASDVLEA